MSDSNLPILYIKPGCPWCVEAQSFFSSQGVEVDLRNVSANRDEMNAMVTVSGQTKTPTLVYKELMVADFDIDEFQAELNRFPEIRRELGISPSA